MLRKTLNSLKLHSYRLITRFLNLRPMMLRYQEPMKLRYLRPTMLLLKKLVSVR